MSSISSSFSVCRFSMSSAFSTSSPCEEEGRARRAGRGGQGVSAQTASQRRRGCEQGRSCTAEQRRQRQAHFLLRVLVEARATIAQMLYHHL